MSLLAGLGWLCGELKVEAWIEGGWGMGVLVLLGGYALGAAVAFRGSASRGALGAAVGAGALTAGVGGLLFWEATRALDEVLQNADPEAAAVVRMAAHREALSLVHLTGWLVVAVGLVLTLRPRGPRPALASAAEVRSPLQEREAHNPAA